MKALAEPANGILARGLVAEVASDCADLRIREGRDQRPQRVGSEERIRIREDDDLARRALERGIERLILAVTREVQDLDARIGEGAGAIDRGIARSVRGDDDLDPVGRIVELAEVLELLANHGLLVMGREDDRQTGSRLGLLDALGGSGKKSCPQREQERKAQPRVEEKDE